MESGIDKQSPEWTKIVSMGKVLLPTHVLFEGADGSAVVVLSVDVAAGVDNSATDDISDFNMASEDMEDFDSDSLDGDSLDFTFSDDGALSNNVEEAVGETQAFASTAEEDLLEAYSTAVLEEGMDFDTDDVTPNADSIDDETLAFDVTEMGSEDASTDESNATDDVFLDFDEDALENELNAAVSHDGETEMLDSSLMQGSDLDLDDAINLDDDLNADSSESAIEIDNDLDELLEDSNSETAMFDSSLFDINSEEAKAFEGDDGGIDEDTVSLEEVQENLTAELETLSFDPEDIDPESMEEDALPTL